MNPNAPKILPKKPSVYALKKEAQARDVAALDEFLAIPAMPRPPMPAQTERHTASRIALSRAVRAGFYEPAQSSEPPSEAP